MGITLAQAVTWFVAALIALVTGGVGTAIVQGLMTRNTARAEAARQTAEEEVARQEAKKAEIERLALVQDIEKKAHDTASAVAEEKYKSLMIEYERVDKRCLNCQEEVAGLRSQIIRYSHAVDALVDAATETIPLLPADAEQTANLRIAVRTARMARYERNTE